MSAAVRHGGRAIAVVSVWRTEARIRARGLAALGERTAAVAAAIAAAVEP